MQQSLEQLANSIVDLVSASEPDAQDVKIEKLSSLSGGNARLAFAFDISWNVKGAPQHRQCVLLLKAGAGQLESNLAREFEIIKSLEDKKLPIPKALWLDVDRRYLRSPAFVMTREPGEASIVQLLKPSDPATTRSLVVQLAELAAKLHRIRPSPEASQTVGVESHIKDIVAYWESVFSQARFEARPAMVHLFDWLARNVPVPKRLCTVHGDFRLGNFLYHKGRITALLDWELAHSGDPAEDIAWAYRQMWSPARFVSIVDFVDLYSSHAGVRIADQSLLYYRVFSEMKFCAISLTAARSFFDGRSSNLRFADRTSMVAPAIKKCFTWLDTGDFAIE